MKGNICLVEDDPGISELICYLLTDIGLDVKAYGTIDTFNRQMDRVLPDLILLDIMLPDGNGIDICKGLKTTLRTKSIPVILMSAHFNVRNLSKENYADDFINKPFDINELTSKVQLHLAHGCSE